MNEQWLQQIVDLLASIDQSVTSLAADVSEMRDVVAELRMDISGFSSGETRVDGQLSQLVDAVRDVESAVHGVDTSIIGLDLSR